MPIFEQIMRAGATKWLTAALIVIDLAAAIPFGISNAPQDVPLTTVEWVGSALLLIVAILLIIGLKQRRVLEIGSFFGILVWIGLAFGTLHDNLSINASATTTTALFVLPLGCALAHLALERHLEHKKY